MEYLLGIDNGGTMMKGALFEKTGAMVCAAQRRTPVISPGAGFMERDMTQLWDLNCQVVGEVLAKSGIRPEQIRAIGCTGHGKGMYPWGGQGPVCNGFASTDSRAEDLITMWKESGVADLVRKKTLQPLLSCQPVAILRWLKESDPQVYEKIRYVFECKDFIRYCLTGEAFAEITDYSGTSLMNLCTKSFDREILELLGIPEVFDKLPPLVYSNDVCGAVTSKAAAQTGLAEGTIVCGGMFDIDACAVGMNVTDEEKLCMITGTWSINEYISQNPVIGSESTKNSLYCLKDYYLIEESSATSAGNLEWYIENFLSSERKLVPSADDFYDQINSLVRSVPVESSQVIFVPYLYGSKAEGVQSAVFAGLNSTSGQAQLLRAIYEGVAFSHYDHYLKLLKNRRPPAAIRLAGGAARSEVWVQMFADIFGVKIETIQIRELGAFGAALTAAVAAGIYRDYNEAAAMIEIDRVYIPNLHNHEIYHEKFMKYQKFANISG